MNIIIKIIFIIILLSVLTSVSGQQHSANETENNKKAVQYFKEKDYNNSITLYDQYLDIALAHQEKADSALRITNDLRQQLSLATDPDKKAVVEKEIIATEKLGSEYQQSANFYFQKAREIEKQISLSTVDFTQINNNEVQETEKIPGRGDQPYIEQTSDAFYKQREISNILKVSEVLMLSELDEINITGNLLMKDAWELQEKKDKLVVVANAAKNRSENRRARKAIGDLNKQVKEKKHQAFEEFHHVNEGKYVIYKSSLTRVLSDSGIIEHLQIKRYNTSATESHQKVLKLKEEAEKTIDEENKFDLLAESNAYALLTLDNQKKALGIYTGLFPVKREPLAYSTYVVPKVKDVNEEKIPEPPVETDNNSNSVSVIRDHGMYQDYEAKPANLYINDFAILPTPDYNKMLNIPVDEALPDGIIYKIQIGVFKSLKSQTYFRGLEPISAETVESTDATRYYAGLFSAFEDAQSALRRVKKLDFRDAYIVAFNNQKKIAAKRAKLLESSNGADASKLEKENEFAAISIESQKENIPDIVFQVQVGAFNSEVSYDMLQTFRRYAGDKKVENYMNNKGMVVYTIGNFITFDSATSFKEELKKKGLKDAFVVALRGKKKISVGDAINLLKKN